MGCNVNQNGSPHQTPQHPSYPTTYSSNILGELLPNVKGLEENGFLPSSSIFQPGHQSHGLPNPVASPKHVLPKAVLPTDSPMSGFDSLKFINDDINSISDVDKYSDVEKFRCSSRTSEYSINSSTKTSKNPQNQQKNNETGSQTSTKLENSKNEQKPDEKSTKTTNQPKIPFSLVPSGFPTAKPSAPAKNNMASLMKQMSAPAGSTSSGVSTGSWKTVAKVANFPKSGSVVQKSKLQSVKSNRPGFMKEFSHLDERWFNLDYCFNNYKIGECPSGKNCKFFKKEDRNSRYNCPFYHTDEDRRRKIDRPQNAKSQYYYKAISCKHAEVDRGIY